MLALSRRLVIAAIVIQSLFLPRCLAGTSQLQLDEGLLGPLWHGQAHFQEVGSVAWDLPPYNNPGESSGWIAVRDGKWYIFNRLTIKPRSRYCPNNYFGIIARESSDHGKTWSNPPAAVIRPGPYTPGAECSIVDGSTYFDPGAHIWHLLTQCLTVHNAGGWSLCHFTRAGESPIGPFVPDPHNPVVKSGELWSKICVDPGKVCDPARTVDEGTPDIIDARDGYFYVTFHGVNYGTRRSYRGVARTRDFNSWETQGPGLPGAAILASADCEAWTPGCVGAGESTTLITGDYQYMLFDGPDKWLGCTNGQTWHVGLVRAPKNSFPKSSEWEQFPRNPVLTPSWPGPESRCSIQYERWIRDGNDVYLLYEDLGPGVRFTERRLLKLVPGPAFPVARIRPPSEHR
jgi:hypothetical protein